LGDRSRGIKHGLNGFLIGYELGQVELQFLAGRVGSIRRRAELGRQLRRAWRGQAGFGWGRPGNWAAPVWGETDGCWAGLGFRPGFGPQSVLLFKIPFPNLFIICKLI
jgi:hypothetical protein